MSSMANAKNRRTMLWASALVVGMVGVSFAAVPLYKIYCQVTGYGGTTQTADIAPDQVFDREVKVRFNSDRAKDLPWVFKPAQQSMDVKVGESRLAFYRARNLSDAPVTGMAVYNVTPPKAGIYFSKIECFCFEQQTLAPGQEVDMPVSFFIDPEMMTDSNMDDVTSITLSYTFYNQNEEATDSTVALDLR